MLYLCLCSFNRLILYKNKKKSYYNYKFKVSTCLVVDRGDIIVVISLYSVHPFC